MLRILREALRLWRSSLAEIAPGAVRWLQGDRERFVLVESDNEVRLRAYSGATAIRECLQWSGALLDLPEHVWMDIRRWAGPRCLHVVLPAERTLQLSWSVPARVPVDSELVRNGLLQRSPLAAAAAQTGWRLERSMKGEQIVHVTLCQRTEFTQLESMLKAHWRRDWTLFGPEWLTLRTAPALHQAQTGWRSWLPGPRLALLLSLPLLPLAVFLGQGLWAMREADRIEVALLAQQKSLAAAQGRLTRAQAVRDAQQSFSAWAATPGAGAVLAALSDALPADASFIELRQDGVHLTLHGLAGEPEAVLGGLSAQPAVRDPQLRLREAAGTAVAREFDVSLRWGELP